MPATPRWHADLARIRASVDQMEAPFLDRRAFEKLFGLRARQANKLMATFGGYRVGPSVLVSREELLLKLVQLESPRGPKSGLESPPIGIPLPKVGREARVRKARVVEELDALCAAARPRRVSPPPPRIAGSALPEGTRISAPSELSIAFDSPEDLLGRILGLAQAAAGDFAAFSAALGFEHSPRPAAHGGAELADMEQP